MCGLKKKVVALYSGVEFYRRYNSFFVEKKKGGEEFYDFIMMRGDILLYF